MTYSYNLVDEPWIPCIHPNGRVEELGLRQTLLRAHELRGLQGDSPLETAALYRLLLAVLHSALRGPATWEAWGDLWEGGRWPPEVLNGYLDQWRERFDLFHPRWPFYQVREEQMAPKGALMLTHGMSTANELFEHSVVTEEVTLFCNQAARNLLVGQAYGMGGLCNPQLKIFLTYAPWARGIIFLAEGNCLFETLALNLIRYDLANDKPMPKTGLDKPVWEMDDPFQQNRKTPLGYLDYLTWPNRKFLLVPEEENRRTVVRKMYIARGFDLDDIMDPFKQYTKRDNDAWKQWVFREERNLWRDSHTLFRLKDPGQNRVPQNFQWLSELVNERYLDASQTFRCVALGMATHYKDAKIFFYRHEILPLPLAYLKNEYLVTALWNALTNADKVRGKLWGAVSTLAKFVIAPNHDLPNAAPPDQENVEKLVNHWAVESWYWGALELPFLRLLEDLPHEPGAVDSWNETLRQTVCKALEQAAKAAGDDPAALKAAVRARSLLRYSLQEIFPKPDNAQNSIETEKEVSA